MCYTETREGNITEVLKHFIRVEATRCKYAKKREEMINWTDLPESVFINRVRNFEEERCDENPAILWTIGTAKDSSRLRKVQRWILANINLGSLYSRGMNSEINVHLDLPDVKGNLKSFVIRKYVHQHKEIRTDTVPTEKELTRFIGVAHRKEGRDGTIEVLDGNHRAMAMLANRIEHAEAYLAILK